MTIRILHTCALLLTLLLTLLPISHADTSPSPTPSCPDAVAVDTLTTTRVNRLLGDLVSRSTFFSVFSVALDKQCPFWPDDSQCVIRECTVCHCEDSEIPPAWLREGEGGECRDGEACSRQKDKLNNVDRSLTGLAALVGQPQWLTAEEDAWTIRDEDHERDYVDLRKNVEQYTGYSGPSARRVWQAIYDENCFTFSEKCRSGICDPDTCKEERVLYTLISGLHASISMHIAKRYLNGGHWGVNTSVYRERVRKHPERTANLKMAYAVVLRAVSKASAMLQPDNNRYVTGDEANDEITRDLLGRLFQLPPLQPGCEDKAFDESDMFLQKNAGLLPEFRNAFRNISMIMDCVGCEKCRLWGKLQFLGLGTALRILFEDSPPELERNEIIALMNLLYKLSESILWVGRMEVMVRRDSRIMAKVGGAFVVMVLMGIALYLRPHSSADLQSNSQGQSGEQDQRRKLTASADKRGSDRNLQRKQNGRDGTSTLRKRQATS